MKVLHVLAGFHTAGIEQLALQLVRHAPPQVELEVLNIDGAIQDFRPSFDAVASERRLHIHDWPSAGGTDPTRAPLDGVALAMRTYRFCRRQRPNAVMIYPCNRRLLWLALGARLAGVGRMGVHYANPPQSLLQLLQLLVVLGGFSLLGVQAQPCSAALLEASGPLIRALSVGRPIPNGVDTASIRNRAAAARSRRPADDPFTVLMIARLDAIKDQATLIEAFAVFHRRVPYSRLWLAGDGPLRRPLEERTAAAGLDPTAVFLGRRRDVPELLGAADLFAYSTTKAEGAPFALIEAVAAGQAIVCSAVAACPEILAGGRAGLLLPPADVELWARTLERLWQNPERRAQLADAASRRAIAFDVHSTAATLYRRLSSRDHAKPALAR